MKEVGKVTKVFKGFFGEELPEEISEKRRKICSTCPFNSVNADKLSLIDGIRNKFTPPFCTLCKCQIHEKTGSPLEECAMYLIGEDKKWFKIKIETMGKEELNLSQVGDNVYDIQLENDYFLINLGKVKATDDTTMDLVFESDEEIELIKMELTCGCTQSKTIQIDDNSISVVMRVDIKQVQFGIGAKVVYLHYKQRGVTKKQKIRIKFNRVG